MDRSPSAKAKRRAQRGPISMADRVDLYSRDCVALEVAQRCCSEDVVAALQQWPKRLQLRVKSSSYTLRAKLQNNRVGQHAFCRGTNKLR